MKRLKEFICWWKTGHAWSCTLDLNLTGVRSYLIQCDKCTAHSTVDIRARSPIWDKLEQLENLRELELLRHRSKKPVLLRKKNGQYNGSKKAK